MILKLVALSILFLFIMATPVWGNLAKSQTDNETIEEAIARLIAEHEADEEAHLGVGESLQSHKAEAVIDHVIGSVLADKLTMTELSYFTIFESLDGWDIVGSVDNADLPGLKLYVEYGSVDLSSVSNASQSPTPFRDSAKNILYQVIARWDGSNTHFNAWLGILNGYGTTDDGFGFVVLDGVLKGRLRYSGTTYYTDAITCDLTADHVFRVQYDATNLDVKFYIDGELVGTLVKYTDTWSDDLGPQIGIELTETNDGNLIVGQLYCARQL